MARLIELEDDDLETIIEMLREYKSRILSGEISGFSQPDEYEINDTHNLITKLERAMH